MDVVLVLTVAGFVVPLVELSKVVDVSIDVVVVVPGTLTENDMDSKNPGVVAIEISIIFASNLISSKSFIIFSIAHFLVLMFHPSWQYHHWVVSIYLLVCLGYYLYQTVYLNLY